MDLDHDGKTDLVSGSWPGELYWFRNRSGTDFDAPVMLKHQNGEIINVEGGIKKQPDGQILITGHTEWESDPDSGKHFVLFREERIESTLENPVATTGCAAHLHVVDWNADGDLDLLVGTIGGNIYFIPNEGSPGDMAFGTPKRLSANDSEIRVDGDASPFCADWDQDGDLDLFSGGDSGSVWFFENVGSENAPVLAERRELIPAGTMRGGDEAPENIVRGGRSKICVHDWNEDGLLDLLVGDVSYQKAPLPLLSPEETKERDKAITQLEKLRKEWGHHISKLHGPNRVKDEKEHARLLEEVNVLREKMRPLEDLVPQKTLYHGSVWLFLQEADS